ncbi:MAG: xanthine dehydrogenase family protein subunit M [Chloroflexi bacterium]|nr:xanthine dehydrogenase family protein subunit M [Chloroflexota bacterium]
MESFDYFEAQSVEEVIAVLNKGENKSRIIAGGTDILLHVRAGLISPNCLVSIKQIESLKGIIKKDDGRIEIGAATNLTNVEQSELLHLNYQLIADAARSIGSRQIRNLATIGGNNCSAVPSADTAPALLASEAEVRIQSSLGFREMPLSDFFVGPKTTILDHDSLLLNFSLPKVMENTGSVYMRFCPRGAMNLPIVSVAVLIALESDLFHIKKSRVALGGVAKVPLRALETESILEGQIISQELINLASNATASSINPISDHRATKEFRYRLAKELTARSILKAIQRAKVE